MVIPLLVLKQCLIADHYCSRVNTLAGRNLYSIILSVFIQPTLLFYINIFYNLSSVALILSKHMLNNYFKTNMYFSCNYEY